MGSCVMHDSGDCTCRRWEPTPRYGYKKDGLKLVVGGNTDQPHNRREQITHD